MVESNKEAHSSPSYDWNKAEQIGKRDAFIQTLIEDFKHQLVQDETFSKSIFSKHFDSFTPTAKKDLYERFETFMGEDAKSSEYEFGDVSLEVLFKKNLDEFRDLLLEKIVIKPYGKITLNGYQIYTICKSISNIEDYVQIQCKKDCIKITFMDASRIMMCTAYFTSETYEFFTEGTISINIEDLTTILKCQKHENNNATLYFGKEHLFIKTHSFEYHSTLLDQIEYIEFKEQDLSLSNLKQIEYPAHFQLHPSQFTLILKKVEPLTEIVDLECYVDKLVLIGEGNIGIRRLIFSKDDLPSLEYSPDKKDFTKGNNKTILRERSSHSLVFLKLINSYSQLLAKDDIIDFCMRTDHPVRIEYETELTKKVENHNTSTSSKINESSIGTFHAINFLAPRALEDDEQEDEDFEKDELNDF